MKVRARIRSVILLLALTVMLLSAGCTRHGARAAFGALHVASAIAQVVAIAAILHHHDAHFHGESCGHSYRYYDGRYNYWYGNHWEYYEGGNWYYY